MQIKRLTTLAAVLLLSLLCGAEERTNLLTEWQEGSSSREVILKKWRFSDWGKRPPKGKSSGRSASVTAEGGKVRMVLENPDENNAVNMAYRQLPLSFDGKKRCRLKLRIANNADKKALVRVQINAYGNKNASRSLYAVLSPSESAEKELSMLPPEGSKGVQIIIKLLGAGKVTVTDPEVTLEKRGSKRQNLGFPGNVILIPAGSPAAVPVILPAERKFVKGEKLLITLPWGIRLISYSPQVTLKKVSVKVKEHSFCQLEFNGSRMYENKIILLLGSDLAPSERVLPAAGQIEGKDGTKGEKVYAQIRIVKDLPAIPPRYFKIAIPVTGKVSPGECGPEVENALFRSGANILISPRQLIPEKQMKIGRISSRVVLPIAPVKESKHCYYSMLRDESFWEEHFAPSLHKYILRYGCRRPTAIFCDKYLGQRRAIFCLCTLCRRELAEFAPQLPRKDVMNLSAGILSSRWGRELEQFRNARLKALWAGAKLYLPVDSRHFARAPQLVPVYTLHEAAAQKQTIRSSEAVIDFGTGIKDHEKGKFNAALSGEAAVKVLKEFRRKSFARLPVTAKFTPFPAALTGEELEFQIVQYILCGYSGVWVNLPDEAEHSLRMAVARSAIILRDHEKFLRRGPAAGESWKLTSSGKRIELPPAPGPTDIPLELPSSVPALRMEIRKNGGATLIIVGNFADVPLEGTLSNSKAPLKFQGSIDGTPVNGQQLRQGVKLSFAPCSWRFIELPGI